MCSYQAMNSNWDPPIITRPRTGEKAQIAYKNKQTILFVNMWKYKNKQTILFVNMWKFKNLQPQL